MASVLEAVCLRSLWALLYVPNHGTGMDYFVTTLSKVKLPALFGTSIITFNSSNGIFRRDLILFRRWKVWVNG
ncbi:hypothetical protein AB6H17_07295 [Proteus vulgaris]|uniref:hypothetical protein n=1 Tax=Proteus vulgaris TaxID=585 RepID=UPI0034DD0335